jgi:hypothetical protein
LAEASFCPASSLQDVIEKMTVGTAGVGFSMGRAQVVFSPEGVVLAVGAGSVVEAAHSVVEELQGAGNERTSEIGKILYCRRKREAEGNHP